MEVPGGAAGLRLGLDLGEAVVVGAGADGGLGVEVHLAGPEGDRDPLGRDGEPLRFDPEAQELFDAFRDTLERRLRSEAMAATPAFESHLAKYRSLMPTLALLVETIEAVARGRQPGAFP